MRPWARWFINHNLRWLLYAVFLFVSVPLGAVYHVIFTAGREIVDDIKYTIQQIKNQQKD